MDSTTWKKSDMQVLAAEPVYSLPISQLRASENCGQGAGCLDRYRLRLDGSHSL